MSFFFSKFVSFFLLFSAFMLILSLNPVYSVFYLILCFLHCIVLFFLLGVDWISLIILILYVGAILILFLFVIMIMNFHDLSKDSLLYNYFFYLFFLVISFFLFFESFFFHWPISESYVLVWWNWNILSWTFLFLQNFSFLFFNIHFWQMILLSFLLFIPLLGGMVSCLHFDLSFKKQCLYLQLSEGMGSIKMMEK